VGWGVGRVEKAQPSSSPKRLAGKHCGGASGSEATARTQSPPQRKRRLSISCLTPHPTLRATPHPHAAARPRGRSRTPPFARPRTRTRRRRQPQLLPCSSLQAVRPAALGRWDSPPLRQRCIQSAANLNDTAFILTAPARQGRCNRKRSGASGAPKCRRRDSLLLQSGPAATAEVPRYRGELLQTSPLKTKAPPSADQSPTLSRPAP
jgi:hypothetical protein